MSHWTNVSGIFYFTLMGAELWHFVAGGIIGIDYPKAFSNVSIRNSGVKKIATHLACKVEWNGLFFFLFHQNMTFFHQSVVHHRTCKNRPTVLGKTAREMYRKPALPFHDSAADRYEVNSSVCHCRRICRQNWPLRESKHWLESILVFLRETLVEANGIWPKIKARQITCIVFLVPWDVVRDVKRIDLSKHGLS